MQVTLSTGRVLDIAALKLTQVRRMGETVTAGDAMSATIQACVDSIKNADASGAPVAPLWFEDTFTIPETNELFAKVTEISGLTVGEAKANG